MKGEGKVSDSSSFFSKLISYQWSVFSFSGFFNKKTAEKSLWFITNLC